MNQEDLKRLHSNAANLKTTLLQHKNIDILLYLAKYNPKVTTKEIEENFGKESLIGLKALEELYLVNEEKGFLTLTEQGLFHVEGLMTLVV
ncbi:MAG: hypothetical protein HY606_11965 [Planctomycetes bacterium]|nr:hypothetical protein [Planctomycetota bacterium]